MDSQVRFLIPLLIAVLPSPLHAQTLDLTRIEAVADSVAGAHIAADAMPAMTVAVARNGTIVFARGYGQANVETGTAAGIETVYGIRSVTKQFTAAAVLRLVEAGTIALDDPITKYLPDYDAQGRTVTVRHLLNHTSGIKDYTARNEAQPNWLRHEVTYAEMMQLWGSRPFDFEPGAQYEYNSMGYWLLGEIVTRVTGAPYGEYVERELLAPLGLGRTVFCDARRVVPNRAAGYDHEGGTLVNAHYVSMSVFRAGGSFCSTVGDLVRWTHLLHGGEVVTAATLQQMTAPTVLTTGDTVGYGYGLKLDELGGHRKVHHGGTFGFGAYLAHYPDDGLTIAVLTNSTRGRDKAEEVEEVLARTAFALPVLDLPMAADAMAPYAGAYTYQAGAATREVRVFAEEGKLQVQFGSGRPMRLRSQGGHVFQADGQPLRLIFNVRGERAEGFAIHAGRWEVTPVTRKP